MLHETASHAVFIDPLVGEDERAFWAWVLVSHGEPVLSDGRAALAGALRGP